MLSIPQLPPDVSIQDLRGRPDVDVAIVARWLKTSFAPNRHHITESAIQARLRQAPDPASGLPRTWVAATGPEPIGCARLVAADHADRPDLSPWLASVYVVPAWRRRGIASALVQTVQAAALAAGFAQVYLYTPDQARLYARHGFTVTGSVVHPDDGRRCDLMVWLPVIGRAARTPG